MRSATVTFYCYKNAMEEGGVEARLLDKNRRVPNHKNAGRCARRAQPRSEDAEPIAKQVRHEMREGLSGFDPGGST